jgi:hypothetical protein
LDNPNQVKREKGSTAVRDAKNKEIIDAKKKKKGQRRLNKQALGR